jgi:hypothetical protein
MPDPARPIVNAPAFGHARHGVLGAVFRPFLFGCRPYSCTGDRSAPGFGEALALEEGGPP